MATKSNSKIEVPQLNIERMTITLVGDTPLICNRFSEKAKKAMLDKMQKKAKRGREIRDPEAEFEAALYKIPDADGLYGFPAMGFKNCAIRGAKHIPDIAMVDAKGFFHVVCGSHMLIPLRYSDLQMVEDTVRIGPGSTDLRYRPYFFDWEVDLDMEFNASVVSIDQIVMMFDIGGFSCGVGEWRPSSPKNSGPYGRFHVKKGDK